MRDHDMNYILRVWKDGKGEHAWRMSLKELGSEEISYFADKARLLERLMPQEEAEEASENKVISS